jgi:hypothetical protein
MELIGDACEVPEDGDFVSGWFSWNKLTSRDTRR